MPEIDCPPMRINPSTARDIEYARGQRIRCECVNCGDVADCAVEGLDFFSGECERCANEGLRHGCEPEEKLWGARAIVWAIFHG